MSTDPALAFLESHLNELKIKSLEAYLSKSTESMEGLITIISHLLQGMDTLRASFEQTRDVALDAAKSKFNPRQLFLFETRLNETSKKVAELVEACHELTQPVLDLNLPPTTENTEE